MKNLVKMMTVMAVMVVMVFAFTGCGSTVDVTGTYIIDEAWYYNESGEYQKLFDKTLTYIIGSDAGLEEFSITEEYAYIDNNCLEYTVDASNPEVYTITLEDNTELTYFPEDGNIMLAGEEFGADYDIWYTHY